MSSRSRKIPHFACAISIPKGAIMRISVERCNCAVYFISIPKGAIMSRISNSYNRYCYISIPKGAIMSAARAIAGNYNAYFNSKRCDYESIILLAASFIFCISIPKGAIMSKKRQDEIVIRIHISIPKGAIMSCCNNDYKCEECEFQFQKVRL